MLNILIYLELLYLFLKISGIEKYLIMELNFTLLNYTILFFILNFMIFNIKQIKIKRIYMFPLLYFTLFISVHLILGSINSSSVQILELIISYINVLICFAFSIHIISSKGLPYLLKIIVLFGGLISLIGIFTWVYETNHAVMPQGGILRSEGLLLNPNLQAETLLFTLIPLIYLFINNQIKFYYFIPLLSINVFSVIITQSRGTIIIGLVVVMMFLLKNQNNNKKLFFIVSSIILLFFFKENLLSYFSRFDVQQNNFSNGRLQALEYGLNGIHNSLFGLGIGNTNLNHIGQSSHNLYVHLLSESGFIFAPILFIVISIFFKMLIYTVKTKNDLLVTPYFIIFILLSGFFDHGIHLQYFTYLLLTIIIYEYSSKRGIL
jgi:hypothetical protein